MNPFVMKLVKLGRAEAARPLRFFAVFRRTESRRWDVIVSGPNLGPDDPAAWAYLSQKLRQTLHPAEVAEVGKALIVAENDPRTAAIEQQIKGGSSPRMSDFEFGEVDVKEGYVVVSEGGVVL